MDSTTLRGVFSAFPSGVVSVCAQVAGRAVGMTVSTFIPVSLEPALVAISVRNDSATWPVLRTSPRVGISLLADGHETVARQLSAPVPDRFAGLQVVADKQGEVWIADAPVLLSCAPAAEFSAGDHHLVTLTIESIVRHAPGDPLVFHDRALSSLRLPGRELLAS